MKTKVPVIFILFVILSACSEKVVEMPVVLSDPADHNMKFIPDNPTSGEDIFLVVFGECNYNILSGITRKATTITVRKQFNSMMKLPCALMNDTIPLGKLPEGIYTVNYKLVDISPVAKDSLALSLAFSLKVSR